MNMNTGLGGTLTASLRPSLVPLLMASSALLPILSLLNFISLSNSSVSGTIIFAAITAAGADKTEAANKCFANKSCSIGSVPPFRLKSQYMRLKHHQQW